MPLSHRWQLYLPILDQPHYRTGQTILVYPDPNIIAGHAQWKYAVQPAEKHGQNSMPTIHEG